jgi:hypothetical protein
MSILLLLQVLLGLLLLAVLLGAFSGCQSSKARDILSASMFAFW